VKKPDRPGSKPALFAQNSVTNRERAPRQIGETVGDQPAVRLPRINLSALFNLASEFAGKTWGKFNHFQTEHERFKYSNSIGSLL
jgi:hypothetical protein